MALCQFACASDAPFMALARLLEHLPKSQGTKGRRKQVAAFRERFVPPGADDLYQTYRLLLPQVCVVWS